MKKVLFIVSSLNYGGAQKIISNVTTTLPEEYDIDILLNSDENIQFPYRGKIYSLDIREPRNREGLWYQFKVFLKRIKYIKKLKIANHYESVISIMTSANVANIICKTKDCKTIIIDVTFLDETPSFKEKYIIGNLVSHFYNKADAIVAETQAVADNLVLKHNVRKEIIYVIPNSINVFAIKRLAENKLDEKESKIFTDKTFVSAGRMVYQKAHWHLIRAFSKVVEHDKDAKLVIFGEGKLKNYLLKLIKEYDLEENIFLYGFTNKLDSYVSKCRAFLFPSMYEGMPIAILQAMAVGVPCIITDFYSGARELLGDEKISKDHIKEVVYTKWGIICPMFSGNYLSKNDDLEENEIIYAGEIIKMLEDNDWRDKYAKAASERSLYFDNSNIIKKWMEVI